MNSNSIFLDIEQNPQKIFFKKYNQPNKQTNRLICLLYKFMTNNDILLVFCLTFRNIYNTDGKFAFKIIADVEELQHNDGTTPDNKSICFQMG